MLAHVFEGYFENGRFYNNDRQMVAIPEKYKTYITLLDERVNKKPFSDLFGEWNGKIWMSEDFDDPIEEMSEYMK